MPQSQIHQVWKQRQSTNLISKNRNQKKDPKTEEGKRKNCAHSVFYLFGREESHVVTEFFFLISQNLHTHKKKKRENIDRAEKKTIAKEEGEFK